MKSYSVSDFCRAHGISRALFYKLLRKGRAPCIMKVGRRTLISQEAAEEWQRQMETAGQAVEASNGGH